MMHPTNELNHLYRLRQLGVLTSTILAITGIIDVHFAQNGLTANVTDPSKEATSAQPLSTKVTGVIPDNLVSMHQHALPDRRYAQATNGETISNDEPSNAAPSNNTSSTTATSDPNQSAPRFTCQYDNSQYVVMYSPESNSREYYAWATPAQMGGGWTPERRCNAIAQRLEIYRPDGLRELQTGEENGYNIVCVTTTQNENCRIVFTVPGEQDPIETRDRVFENLAVANSGQQTEGVNTFQDHSPLSSIWSDLGTRLGIELPQQPAQNSDPSSNTLNKRSQSIDLRPFLSPADGGTGRNL